MLGAAYRTPDERESRDPAHAAGHEVCSDGHVMGHVERSLSVQAGGDLGDCVLAKQVVELLARPPHPVPGAEEPGRHAYVLDVDARSDVSASSQPLLHGRPVVPSGHDSDVVAGLSRGLDDGPTRSRL